MVAKSEKHAETNKFFTQKMPGKFAKPAQKWPVREQFHARSGMA
jgi:hypothetical protein